MSETTYNVTGMTCGHCVNSVTEEIGKIDGVTDVRVDLPSGAVTVVSPQEPEVAEVRAAVEEAGYELTA
ncbi:heavy-metal-associated domain-containing protein [Amycolatopsis sp. lyj-112]|uniref:heavy-metal-associated domain-containing protein n=1 Tax=Amycolatopsis sp. lyj-112 TaxID=2789288 RepID=UPI00397A037B